MSDDLLNRLKYFAFKLEGKGQLESAASDTMVEAAACFVAHSAEIYGLRADNERLRKKIKWLMEDDDRLWYVLYKIANPRPFADCPVEMAQNATRGEHLRIEAFDGIRRVLEGKP